MAKYKIINNFKKNHIEFNNKKISPGHSDFAPVIQDLEICAYSDQEIDDCKINFNTKGDIDFQLTLKRKGKSWLLKDFSPLESGFGVTDNPKVEVSVDPDEQ